MSTETKTDPYESIRGKSEKEITEMIDNGDTFIRGIISNPEERSKLLAGELTTPLKEEENPDKKGEENVPDPKSEEDPGKKEDKPKEDEDKFAGHGSLEGMKNALKSAQALVKHKQEAINERNAAEGRRGSEMKKLKEEHETLKAEYEKAKKEKETRSLEKGPEVEIDMPDMPVLPIPPDGDFLDENYQKEIEAHRQATKDFNKKYKAAIKSQKPAKNNSTAALEKKLADATAKIEQIQEAQKARAGKEAETTRKGALGNIFTEIDGLQKGHAELKMTHSFKEVDDFIAATGADIASACEEAKKVYPEEDVKKYAEIMNLVSEQRGIKDGQLNIYGAPKDSLEDRYSLKLLKMGKVPDKKTAEKPDNSAVEQMKREAEKVALDKIKNLTPGLDSSNMGGEADKLTKEAAMKELEEITTKLSSNPNLKNNAQLMAQWKELGIKCGVSVPDIR